MSSYKNIAEISGSSLKVVAPAAKMMAENGYASKDEDSNDDDQNPNENVFTIPPFTAEEELREKASLTADERRSIMVDVFGLGQTLSGMALQHK